MILEYHNVDIIRAERVLLSQVNWQVNEGEFVYLTGVVGSGKSSLLKTIYGELDITSGTATVLGRDMLHLRRSQTPALRRQLGIVFQDFQLLTDRTVFKNLDFVLKSTGWSKRHRRARVEEVLDSVGMLHKIEAMPYELSGGEQQRVCIARAILNSPKLILADEATGNQDYESSLETTRILHELAQQGTAVIFATHNNALISQFPGRVFRLTDGTLQELHLHQEPSPGIPKSQLPHAENAENAENNSFYSSDLCDISSPDTLDDIPLATIAQNSPQHT